MAKAVAVEQGHRTGRPADVAKSENRRSARFTFSPPALAASGTGGAVVQEQALPCVRQPIFKHLAGPSASDNEQPIKLWRVHRPHDISSDVLRNLGSQSTCLGEILDDRSHAAGMARQQLIDKLAQLSVGRRSFQHHLPDRREAFEHRAGKATLVLS